jgi:hypothetical protein
MSRLETRFANLMEMFRDQAGLASKTSLSALA